MLIGESGAAMLSDFQLHAIAETNGGGYCAIPSKCRWMPWERLIEDDACALGGPSKAADIYGAATTIMQVRRLSVVILPRL